ncbi:hypothetical protein [Treponema bryantii]|uniref:hypothetical protein n=1 Tax=Treponema bryantii TaxID=163 RepID=UPI002B2B0F40|nr:hypothetical protein TRBR_26370 [Treponema bryantii]
MKKLFACIFAVSVISTAAFSRNFFSQRFFEIKAGTELGASNNLFTVNELLQKDLIIDLPQLADECPDNGFNIRAGAKPIWEMNFNIVNVHVGLSAGLELYESMSVGKDLFDFLGNGNSVGDVITFSLDNDADVFAFSHLDIGIKFGRLKVEVQPAVFIPVVSMRGGGAKATVVNGSDGSLDVSMDMNMDVYSFTGLSIEDNKINFDIGKISAALTKGFGFDFGLGLSWDLTKSFTVGLTSRIPIVPGTLGYKSNIQWGMDYSVKVSDYENPEKTEREKTVTNEYTTLTIHRPLKVNIYADKDLLGTLFNARAGVGFGIRRPFTSDAIFYPEYYLGIGLNLINAFKLNVSTEYKDQVFIHQLGTTINLRLVQFDFGISTQSPNFIKSMEVAGLGGYAYVSVGF